VSSVARHLDPNKKCALLRYSKANAEAGANALADGNMEFIYVPQSPIADITTNAAWLYNAIAKYFILPQYSAYDFRDEIPNEVVGNRKILSYIKKSLSLMDESIKHEDVDEFIKHIGLMADYLGYEIKEDHCQKVYETISKQRFHPAFTIDELQRIAITFHSSKGLEFEQVILFVSDYRLSRKEDIYNHYVAATRAKSKLILVYIDGDGYARQFADNIKKILGKSGLQMNDVATVVRYTQ
jgi:superfamily I DNA/RNA helicase